MASRIDRFLTGGGDTYQIDRALDCFKSGGLFGAGPGEVVMGDTLSVKVFQALSAALALRPDRRVILSDNGNFPSDLYVAEGLARVCPMAFGMKTAH